MKPFTPSILLLLLFFLSTNLSYSQKKRRGDFYGRSNIDVLRANLKDNGFILSFGATNMFSFDERRAKYLEGSTNQEYFFNSDGDWALMFELGMLHFTKRKSWGFLKIDHYDWTVGIKNFRGWEETRLVTRDDPNADAQGETGRGEFSLGYLSGRATLHNLIKLRPRIHLDQGLGANFDYRVFGNSPGDNSGYEPIVLPTTQTFQRDFLAQLHYEIGFRFRTRKLIFITPMLHVPLISAYEWSGGRSTINWFSSRYQPWLIKVKFMFPRLEKKAKCPAVYSNPDDERRNKEYLQGK
jgi:hypothetical protein